MAYNYTVDIIDSLREINEKRARSNLYLMIVDGELKAATAKIDIDKCLREFDATSILDGSLQIDLLYGFVLNLKELPYKIPHTVISNSKCVRSLYLLYDSDSNGVAVLSFSSIEEATIAIEELFEQKEILDLTEAVLIIGEELDFAVSIAEAGNFLHAKDVYED